MTKLIYYFLTYLLFIYVSYSLSGCKKEKYTADPNSKLSFSRDSILFDTVFTQAGSTTRQLLVRNNNSQKIKINSISIREGNNTKFIINVDGQSGKTFSNIEIAAKDSMYIFIQVYINPTLQNNPFIINDAIVFEVNGNKQNVILEAWGQNAYYHYPTDAIKFKDGTYLPYSIISASNNSTVTWANDKPHVIYGWCVVDSSQTLIVPAGTKVYFYQNGGLWTYRYGTLKVQGIKGNEVIFQGYRKEPEYADEPGQWDRIWINEGSVNNEINYAIIKNGFIGIQADLLSDNYGADPRRLKLTNTKISNMKKWGLYSLGYNIYAGNNVIANCKEQCVNLFLGGNYNFIHCTFANFWKKDSRDKTLFSINNYYDNTVFPLDTCNIFNSIIEGNKDSELSIDLKNTNTSFIPKYYFHYCCIKNQIISDSHFSNCKFSQSIIFKDKDTYDFSIIDNNSSNINFSNLSESNKFQTDINGVNRLINPDAGAYKKN
ncbi:hypothetical protein [Flavobacterium filum]|uniref:hypothetical protein n=1 Tax=Flavobacterium filum TaxID=370974 RepID=UPI0023F2E59E|nr:hypothetical protein [Flavobacterium filum]